VLEHLGLTDDALAKASLPEKSFAPLLAGKRVPPRAAIFHEYENTRMIRTDQFKLTSRWQTGRMSFTT